MHNLKLPKISIACWTRYIVVPAQRFLRRELFTSAAVLKPYFRQTAISEYPQKQSSDRDDRSNSEILSAIVLGSSFVFKLHK